MQLIPNLAKTSAIFSLLHSRLNEVRCENPYNRKCTPKHADNTIITLRVTVTNNFKLQFSIKFEVTQKNSIIQD